MRFDLHVHTSNHSPCAHSSVGSICRAALERGLDGIALTEHDRWWDAADLGQVREEHPGLVVLGGVEVSCPEGHFLVFVPPGDEFALEVGFDLHSLSRVVRDREGILVWAHPFRYDRSLPPWLGTVPLDAMEIASTNLNGKAAALARAAAEEFGIRGLENSDAHRKEDVGRCFNKFEGFIESESDLIENFR